MTCTEFREQILDRIAGELSPEQEQLCSLHERSCQDCGRELARWRRLEGSLRSGWPSEDPPPLTLFLPPRASRDRFQLAWVWFARASAGLIAACLVLLVLLRPTMRWRGSELQIAFGPTVVETERPAVEPLTAEQVKAWVDVAVKQEVAGQLAPAKPALYSTELAKEDAQRGAQVALHLKMLEESQAFLWQQVEQQGLYLQSAWHGSASEIQPQSNPRSERQ